MKITCVRFNQDQKTQRMKPEYYVMLSRGWKVRFGSWAKEPFERIYKNPFKGVEVPDVRMDELIRAMKAKGWDRLPETDLDRIDIHRLAQVEREARGNPLIATQTRYLTVQVDNARRTVSYEDVLRTGDGRIHQAFVDCELIALKGAMQHTVQVTVETMPLPLK